MKKILENLIVSVVNIGAVIVLGYFVPPVFCLHVLYLLICALLGWFWGGQLYRINQRP